MTIKDLIKHYSRILSQCENELSDLQDDDTFPYGYCYGQVDTFKCVIRDLKELEEYFSHE